MEQWGKLIVAVCAFLGGLVYAGYFALKALRGGEGFDGAKFGMSVLAAGVGAAAFGLGYIFLGPIGVGDCLTAFLGGIGVTAAGGKVLAGDVMNHYHADTTDAGGGTG